MDFCAACLVQRSGWTRDIDLFLQWLSSIHFGGGGFNDAAIAEGLAEALMVCQRLNQLDLFILSESIIYKFHSFQLKSNLRNWGLSLLFFLMQINIEFRRQICFLFQLGILNCNHIESFLCCIPT